MKNEILEILLKNRTRRSVAEIMKLMSFWRDCNQQEFKYAWQISNLFSNL